MKHIPCESWIFHWLQHRQWSGLHSARQGLCLGLQATTKFVRQIKSFFFVWHNHVELLTTGHWVRAEDTGIQIQGSWCCCLSVCVERRVPGFSCARYHFGRWYWSFDEAKNVCCSDHLGLFVCLGHIAEDMSCLMSSLCLLCIGAFDFDVSCVRQNHL